MATITVCEIFTDNRARPLNVCMVADWSIKDGLKVVSCLTAGGKTVRPKLTTVEYEALHTKAWRLAFGYAPEPVFQVEWVRSNNASPLEDKTFFVENLSLF